MQHLAALAAAFTPQVSIEPPDGLLLEIKPSISAVRRSARVVPPPARRLSRRSRCSRSCAPRRISRSRPRRSPRWRRRVPARAASSPIRRCCPRGSNRCRWPYCAGRKSTSRGSRPWACARWASCCVCRAPDSRGASARSCSPIWIACWADAPIRGRGSRRGNVIAARSISITKSRITNASCRRWRRCSAQLEQFLRARQRGVTALQCRFHHYRAAPDALHAAAGRARGRVPNGSRACCASGWHRWCCPSRYAAASCAAARSRPLSLASRPLWSPGEHGHVQHGRNALAGRASARPARCAGAVWHSPRVGASAGACLARGRARDRADTRR